MSGPKINGKKTTVFDSSYRGNEVYNIFVRSLTLGKIINTIAATFE